MLLRTIRILSLPSLAARPPRHSILRPLDTKAVFRGMRRAFLWEGGAHHAVIRLGVILLMTRHLQDIGGRISFEENGRQYETIIDDAVHCG